MSEPKPDPADDAGHAGGTYGKADRSDTARRSLQHQDLNEAAPGAETARKTGPPSEVL